MTTLVLTLPEAEAELAADWLWGLGAVAIEERSTNDGVTLVAGFDDDDHALAARTTLGERWPARFESAPDEAEWRDVWLRHLEPVTVGPFVIHPPWLPVSGVDARPMSIDPGRAFGSGHHQSTQLAIGGLADVVGAGDAVLDLGCGTGVLSIAAAMLGADQVIGIDLDHDILEVAQANVEANSVEDRVRLATTRLDDLTSTFDVVVVNITAGTLAPLLPAIDALAETSLVVSGLLTDQQGLLESALGRPATSTRTSGDWRSLTFLS